MKYCKLLVFSILISVLSFFFFLIPNDQAKIEYISKNLSLNQPIAFSDGPIQVESFYVLNFCSSNEIVNFKVSGLEENTSETRIKLFQNQVQVNSAMIMKDDLCSETYLGLDKNISIWTSNGHLGIKLLNESISIIEANKSLKIFIKTNLYQNSKTRRVVGDFVAFIAIVSLFLLIGRQVTKYGRAILGFPNFILMPTLVLVFWGFFGPPIYDEGWVLATGKSFSEIGWFSNVYSNSSAPMPLGAVFNYVSYLITSFNNPLLLARSVWVVFAIIALIQLQILGNQVFPETTKKVKASFSLAFIVYLVAFGGGWRPEILLLVVFNALLIHLFVEKKSSTFLIGSLIGFSLSTAQSGLIFLGPLIYLLHRKIINKYKAAYIMCVALCIFSIVSLSFTNLTQLLKGIAEFRGADTHTSIPVIGEVYRYTPLIFGTQSIIVTFAFFLLLGSILSILFYRNSINKEMEFFQYILLSSLLLLTLSPSKWWWHLLPQASLVLLSLVQLKHVLKFKKATLITQSILFIVVMFCANSFINSLVSNKPISAAYPLKTFSPPDAMVSFAALSLIAIAIIVQAKLRARPQIGEAIELKLSALTNFTLIGLLIVICLPIIENRIFSDGRVSNLFQSRLERECESLAKLKTLDLTSQEIQENEMVFGKESSTSAKQFFLETDDLEGKSKDQVFYFSVRANNGATISLTDGHMNPYPVYDLTLPGREWSSTKVNERSVRQFFESTRHIIDGIYIYPSPYSQVVSFSLGTVLPDILRLMVSSSGTVSFSAIKATNLIDLTSYTANQPTFIIPPLVSHFGCISNNLFTNAKLLDSVIVIQDSGQWFGYSDPNTFKTMSGNLRAALLPIYGTYRAGLFSILRVEPFKSNLENSFALVKP